MFACFFVRFRVCSGARVAHLCGFARTVPFASPHGGVQSGTGLPENSCRKNASQHEESLAQGARAVGLKGNDFMLSFGISIGGAQCRRHKPLIKSGPHGPKLAAQNPAWPGSAGGADCRPMSSRVMTIPADFQDSTFGRRHVFPTTTLFGPCPPRKREAEDPTAAEAGRHYRGEKGATKRKVRGRRPMFALPLTFVPQGLLTQPCANTAFRAMLPVDTTTPTCAASWHVPQHAATTSLQALLTSPPTARAWWSADQHVLRNTRHDLEWHATSHQCPSRG